MVGYYHLAQTGILKTASSLISIEWIELDYHLNIKSLLFSMIKDQAA